MSLELVNKPDDYILIVDDDPVNLRILAKQLGKRGYVVNVAPNGLTALQLVDSILPDLILPDIMMPDMDGYEVCPAIKANERTCHIPVIFLSALEEVPDKIKAFSVGGTKSGCNSFIKQPFWAPIDGYCN